MLKNSVTANIKRSQAGVVIIETVLILPIFFALVFLALGYGYWQHSKNSLSSSIIKGVRAGATRGNADLMNSLGCPGAACGRIGLISKIEEFHNGSGNWNSVSELFKTGDVTSAQAEAMYNSWVNAAFSGGSLQNMPTEALYSLFYTLEFMRVTFGGMIRTPCDPDNGDPVGSPNRCLRCEFMGYEELGCADDSGNPDPAACRFVSSTLNIPADRYGIRCSFRPYMTFANMMGLVGTKAKIITKSSFSYEVERPEFG